MVIVPVLLLLRLFCPLVEGNDYLARVYITQPPLQLGMADDGMRMEVHNCSLQEIAFPSFYPSFLSNWLEYKPAHTCRIMDEKGLESKVGFVE